MAEVVWTTPALTDLDAIADHIALDNEDAARRLVRPPRRVFYRVDGRRVYILHVMRSQQRLRRTRLRSPHRAPPEPGRSA